MAPLLIIDRSCSKIRRHARKVGGEASTQILKGRWVEHYILDGPEFGYGIRQAGYRAWIG